MILNGSREEQCILRPATGVTAVCRSPLLAGRRSPAAPPLPAYSSAPRHLISPRSVPREIVSSETIPRRTCAGNRQGPDPNGTGLPGPRPGSRDTQPHGKSWHLLEAAQQRGEDHSTARPARHRKRRGGGVREDTVCGSHARSSSGSWTRLLETGAPCRGGGPRLQATRLVLRSTPSHPMPGRGATPGVMMTRVSVTGSVRTPALWRLSQNGYGILTF